MTIDERLYRLPIVGAFFRRLYSYFKKHTAFTDGIHVALGLGIAFLYVGDKFFYWGVIALTIAILAHIYA